MDADEFEEVLDTLVNRATVALLILLAIVLVVVMCSCKGYQVEPYGALSFRDEQFTPSGGADTYTGWTYTVGARYVPPTEMPIPVYVQPVGSQGAPVTVTTNAAQAPKSDIEAATDAVKGTVDALKGVEWSPSTVWALAVPGAILVALAWLLLKFRKGGKTP